jgi:hypothetical protein
MQTSLLRFFLFNQNQKMLLLGRLLVFVLLTFLLAVAENKPVKDAVQDIVEDDYLDDGKRFLFDFLDEKKKKPDFEDYSDLVYKTYKYNTDEISFNSNDYLKKLQSCYDKCLKLGIDLKKQCIRNECELY